MTKESGRDCTESNLSESWVTVGDIVVIGGGGHELELCLSSDKGGVS